MTTHHDPGAGDDRHRAMREMLGAHALGHLDGSERAAVDAHLATCHTCRDELALLEPGAGSLAALGPDIPDDPARAGAGTPGPEPSDEGFAGILARVRAERAAPALDPPTVETTFVGRPRPGGPRRAEPGETTVTPLRRGSPRMLRVAAAAAVVVLALGGLGTGLGLSGGSGPVGEAVAVRALDPGVSASADVIAHTWGVELELEATGFAPGRAYQVAVLDASGRPVGAGAFLGTGDREMVCRLNASILRGDASGFVVTDTAGVPVLASSFT